MKYTIKCFVGSLKNLNNFETEHQLLAKLKKDYQIVYRLSGLESQTFCVLFQYDWLALM